MTSSTNNSPQNIFDNSQSWDDVSKYQGSYNINNNYGNIFSSASDITSQVNNNNNYNYNNNNNNYYNNSFNVNSGLNTDNIYNSTSQVNNNNSSYPENHQSYFPLQFVEIEYNQLEGKLENNDQVAVAKRASRISRVITSIKEGVKSATKGLGHRVMNTFRPESFIKDTNFSSDYTLRRNENGQYLNAEGKVCKKKDAEKITRAATRFSESPITAGAERVVGATFSRQGLVDGLRLNKKTTYSTAELKTLKKELAQILLAANSNEITAENVMEAVEVLINSAKNGEISREFEDNREAACFLQIANSLTPRSREILGGIRKGTLKEANVLPLRKAAFTVVNQLRQAWNLVAKVEKSVLGLIQTPMSPFMNSRLENGVTLLVSGTMMVAKVVLVPAALVSIVAAKAFGYTSFFALVGAGVITYGVAKGAAAVVGGIAGKTIGAGIEATQNGRNKSIDREILRHQSYLLDIMERKLDPKLGNSDQAFLLRGEIAKMKREIDQHVNELKISFKTKELASSYVHAPTDENEETKEVGQWNLAKDLPPTNPKNFDSYLKALKIQIESFDSKTGYSEAVRNEYRSSLGITTAGYVLGRQENRLEREAVKADRAEKKRIAQQKRAADKEAKKLENANKPGLLQRVKNKFSKPKAEEQETEINNIDNNLNIFDF